MRLLLIIMISLAMLTGISRAEGTPVSGAWMDGLQAQLTSMGISTEATNASRAVILSLLREADPKARAISAEKWEAIGDERAGRRATTGISLGMTNGLPYILAIATNAPVALEDGVAEGDLIVGIGTQTFDKISLPAAQALMRNDPEAPLALRVIHRDATNDITAVREVSTDPTIALAELLPNNVGYLKVNGLYATGGRDIVSRIRSWSETGRDGVILDLRGAGGGDLTAVAEIAGLFVPPGQFIYAFRDLHQQDLEVIKSPEGTQVALPLMTLVDSDTTAASEVLAAVLNASARQALLIGEPTRGDFLLRERVEIAGHSILVALKVLDTADGIRYGGQFGVQPPVLISETERDTYDYEPPEDLLDTRETLPEEAIDFATRRRVRGDGTLERAIDVLTGLKTLNKAGGGVSSGDSY